jgi:hypothetical protein
MDDYKLRIQREIIIPVPVLAAAIARSRNQRRDEVIFLCAFVLLIET